MRVDLSENELRVARMVAVERQLYGRKNYEDKKKMDDGFQARMFTTLKKSRPCTILSG